MASCGEMKKGQVYVCADCGFEVEVVKECKCDHDSACQPDKEHCCGLECCGKPMTLK